MNYDSDFLTPPTETPKSTPKECIICRFRFISDGKSYCKQVGDICPKECPFHFISPDQHVELVNYIKRCTENNGPLAESYAMYIYQILKVIY